MQEETQPNDREFGSEADVERITGRKRRTLQKDRCFGRGFPFYRFGRQILYDLQEVRGLIRAGRVLTAGENNQPEQKNETPTARSGGRFMDLRKDKPKCKTILHQQDTGIVV